MKAGDRVKLIGIPPNLRDQDDMLTLTLFEKCLGQSFVVAEMETVEGLPYAWRYDHHSQGLYVAVGLSPKLKNLMCGESWTVRHQYRQP